MSQWTKEELEAIDKLCTPPDYVPLTVTNTPRADETTEQVAARPGKPPDYVPADPSRGILNVRGSTHGDFEENGKIMQGLKATMRAHVGWQKLAPYQKEALEMIQNKIGRILCGDHTYYDHWRDIAGYAKLVEERCPKLTDGIR